MLEARLKQEEPVSPVPTAVVSASAPHSAGYYQMVYLGTGSASDPLRIGETASPWTHHPEQPTDSLLVQSSRLQVAIIQARVFRASAHGLSLATMKPRMMIIILLVSQLSLIWPHTNLI